MISHHRIERTENHVHVDFTQPHWVLSSAILNGGLVQANHIVNVRVEQNFQGEKTDFDPPEVTMSRYCEQMGYSGLSVGLMTAASMTSFRQVRRVEQGVAVIALVTAGLSNARRAGDPADWRHIQAPEIEPGTINIIMLTTACLTPAALVEAVMIVTEAKAATLQDLGVKSRVSGDLATGTGTDAIVVASGVSGPTVRYCGKHALLGEMLASSVIEALHLSLQRDAN